MKKFINWLSVCAIVTITFLAIYATGQQVLRQGAYDPQIQLAEDTANALSGGTNVFSVLSGQAANVDMAKSLAPFYFIYDDSDKVVQSNAVMGGQTAPNIPTGVLNYAKSRGEDKISWQPKDDLRYALVAVRYSSTQGSGYVVFARSMRVVENRIKMIGLYALLGWLASLVIFTGKELWQHKK